MTPIKVQMLCLFFVMLRVIVGDIFFSLWQLPGVKPTDIMIRYVLYSLIIFRNAKTVASVLAYGALDFVKSRTISRTDSQQHLAPDKRIKSRESPIQFKSPMELKDEDPNGDYFTKRKNDELNQMVTGLYLRDELGGYFNNKVL
jgi:hypothetical protein